MANTPDSTTSLTLLGRLRQGATDQAAWDAFVERYGRKIYGWCRHWQLQQADAEDVTQDGSPAELVQLPPYNRAWPSPARASQPPTALL